MNLCSSNVIEILGRPKVSPSIKGFSEVLNSSHATDGVSKHPNMRIRLLDWNDALDANPQGAFIDKAVHIITGADLVC